jgi:hypothetical protein
MAFTVQNVDAIVRQCRWQILSLSMYRRAVLAARFDFVCAGRLGRRVSSFTGLFHIVPFHSKRYTSVEMESCRAIERARG